LARDRVRIEYSFPKTPAGTRYSLATQQESSDSFFGSQRFAPRESKQRSKEQRSWWKSRPKDRSKTSTIAWEFLAAAGAPLPPRVAGEPSG